MIFRHLDPEWHQDHPLFTTEAGQGQDRIVLLPGLGGTTRYWNALVGRLTPTMRCLRIDLLGFGESPKPWTTYDLDTHLRALDHALPEDEPFWLVGHSLGALLALAYSVRHRSRVRGLVLIGMPLFESRDHAFHHLRGGAVRGGWLWTNWALTMVTCILTRRVLGRLLPYLLKDIPREVAEDLVKHTWRSSTSSLWEVVYGHDAFSDLAIFPEDLPVLVVHGADDHIAPIRPLRDLVADMPGWELISMPGVDHHPILRQPEASFRLLAEFFCCGAGASIESIGESRQWTINTSG